MAIRHSTPADSSFSPAGKTAWDADHTGTAADLTFTQSGIGARSRNLQTKVRELELNVMDFGAVFDGNSNPLSSRYASLANAQVDYPFAVSLTQELDWAGWQAAINAAKVIASTTLTIVDVVLPAARGRITETIDHRGTYSGTTYPGNMALPVRSRGHGKRVTIVEWWGTQPATSIRKAMVMTSKSGTTLRDMTLTCPRRYRTLASPPAGLSAIRTPYYGVVVLDVTWFSDFTNLEVDSCGVPLSVGIIKTAKLATTDTNGIEFEPVSGGVDVVSTVDFAQSTIRGMVLNAQVDEVTEGIAGFTTAWLAGTNDTTPSDTGAYVLDGSFAAEFGKQQTVGINLAGCTLTASHAQQLGAVRLYNVGTISISNGGWIGLTPPNSVAGNLTAAIFENLSSLGSVIILDKVEVGGLRFWRGSVSQGKLTIRNCGGEAQATSADVDGDIKVIRPLGANASVTPFLDIDGLSLGRGGPGIPRVLTLTDVTANPGIGYISPTATSFANKHKIRNVSSLDFCTHGQKLKEPYYEGMFDPKPNLIPNFPVVFSGKPIPSSFLYAKNVGVNTSNLTMGMIKGKKCFIPTAAGVGSLALGANIDNGETYVVECKVYVAYPGALATLYGLITAKVSFFSAIDLTAIAAPLTAANVAGYTAGLEGFLGISSSSQGYASLVNGAWVTFRKAFVSNAVNSWPGVNIVFNYTAAFSALGFADLAIYRGPVPDYFDVAHGEELLSAVAPATGTWIVRDRVGQLTPAVASPKGWLCTVAGAPGTWVSEGNL